VTERTEPVPTLVLDVLGRRCPAPVIELARHIGEVAVGEVVCVLADDPAAALDIPAWCELRRHTYVGRCSVPDGSPGHLVRRRS
jgi:TusA-related sulfurtransferase